MGKSKAKITKGNSKGNFLSIVKLNKEVVQYLETIDLSDENRGILNEFIAESNKPLKSINDEKTVFQNQRNFISKLVSSISGFDSAYKTVIIIAFNKSFSKLIGSRLEKDLDLNENNFQDKFSEFLEDYVRVVFNDQSQP